MNKKKITMVSYWNTKPFLYGLQNSELSKSYDIELAIPSECGEQLIQGQTDVALVPVVALSKIKNYHIVGDYCISCDGPVKSVCLFSKVPIQEIERIILDYQSMTSVQLLQILLMKHWKLSPELVNGFAGYREKITGTTAGLVIGDRTFEMFGQYSYIYDLGAAWKEMTGLPFVFAAWASRKPVEVFIERLFNDAFQFGLDHLDEVISEIQNDSNSEIDFRNYLTENLQFKLDDVRKKALSMFLEEIKVNEGSLQY